MAADVAQTLFERAQLRAGLYGGLVTALIQRVYGRLIETEHIIARHLGVDVDVQQALVQVEGVVGEEVDAGHQQVSQVQDFIGPHGTLAQVYADDDIGSHPAGDVGGEVVTHTAVYQHHPVGAHRSEEARDAHRGAQGQIHGTVVPHLGPAGSHIRGDAGKGNGELEEVGGVTVAHRAGADDVVHVLAENEAGGQAARQVVAGQTAHIGRTGTQVQFARAAGGEGHIAPQVVLVVVGLIIEGELQQIFVPVAEARVRHILAGHFVAQGHIPVHFAHQFIQVVGLVAQGIHTAQQAADGGTHHHIHGNIQLFQVFEHADGSRTLGAAAGKNQGHRGTLFADFGHTGTNLIHSLVVVLVQAESGGRRTRNLVILALGSCRKGEQQHQGRENLFHRFSWCLPARRPQAAKMSSPRDARIVAVIPPSWRRSRKASISFWLAGP